MTVFALAIEHLETVLKWKHDMGTLEKETIPDAFLCLRLLPGDPEEGQT